MNSLSLLCPRCQQRLEGDDRLGCPGCDYELHLVQGVWRDDAMLPPAGFPQRQQEHLSDIEKRHFWFGPRDRLLHQQAQRAFPSVGAALELGGGSGRLLPVWDEMFDTVVMVEPYTKSLEAAALRGSSATLIQADACKLPFDTQRFDVVMAFDVLEHVPASTMLGEARRVARDGAKLLISVPAFQSLWSYADEMAGHRCRYDLKGLKSELQNHGWRIEGHTHYQCALFPLLWVSRRLLGRRAHATERNPARIAGRLLGAINAAEVALCSRVSLPFGSSLIAWAEAV